MAQNYCKIPSDIYFKDILLLLRLCVNGEPVENIAFTILGPIQARITSAKCEGNCKSLLHSLAARRPSRHKPTNATCISWAIICHEDLLLFSLCKVWISNWILAWAFGKEQQAYFLAQRKTLLYMDHLCPVLVELSLGSVESKIKA